MRNGAVHLLLLCWRRRIPSAWMVLNTRYHSIYGIVHQRLATRRRPGCAFSERLKRFGFLLLARAHLPRPRQHLAAASGICAVRGIFPGAAFDWPGARFAAASIALPHAAGLAANNARVLLAAPTKRTKTDFRRWRTGAKRSAHHQPAGGHKEEESERIDRQS